MLTHKDVMKKLDDAIQEAGNASCFAVKARMSQQFISDVRRDRRGFGKQLLDYLGLEQVTLYREKRK